MVINALFHVAIKTNDHEFRRRFAEMGFPYREFLVPGTTLWQLFVYDPSGVQLELTFEVEKDPEPDLSPGRRYVAGAGWVRASAREFMDRAYTS